MSDQDFKNRIKAVAFDQLIPGRAYSAEALHALRADVEYELNGGVEVIADPIDRDSFAAESKRFGPVSIDTIHAYLNGLMDQCLDMETLTINPEGDGFSLVIKDPFKLFGKSYKVGNTAHFDARYVIQSQSSPVV